MAGGRPIETVITTDVSDVVSGAERVADSYDEIQDSLRDTARASDRAADSMEDDARDAARVIDRDLTRALDNVADEARTTGRAVGSSMEQGTRDAGQATETFRDETRANLSESISSFRGDVEDIPQLLQDVLGGVSADLGLLGGGIAIAAAAAVGLTIASLQGQADKINEAKENMLALAETIRDNGGVLTEADYIKQMDDYGYAIQDTKEWFEIFQSEAVSGFEKIKEASEASGLSIKQVFDGGFGDVDEATKTLELVGEKLEEVEGRAEALYNLDGSIDPVDSKTISTLEEYKEQVEDNIKAQKDAKRQEDIRKEAIKGTTQALREDIAAMEQRADVMKGSVTSELDYLDGIDNLTEKLETSGNAWDKNTAAGRENQRAVIDVTNDIEDMAKAQLDAGVPMEIVTANMNAQANELATKLAPAFGGSEEAARKFIEQVLKTPKETKTTVKLEGEADVRAGLERLSRPVSVLLKPEAPSETYFQGVLNQLSGRSVGVTLTPKLGQGSGV